MNGDTDEAVKIGRPLVQISNGSTGYVVAPVIYYYKQRGKAMHEPATITFALKRVRKA